MLKTIKGLRGELGISQSELAAVFEVSSGWINQIENFRRTSPKLEKKVIAYLTGLVNERNGEGGFPVPSGEEVKC